MVEKKQLLLVEKEETVLSHLGKKSKVNFGP